MTDKTYKYLLKPQKYKKEDYNYIKRVLKFNRNKFTMTQNRDLTQLK